ncbi:MAG: glutathione S-transferase C-terminal domain-containing protein, partial [Deltaproteobacteria bacterium]|nr:glutathione S-transferase C-terminal domain-containing protein [Deltaproteobacteria bacterium]
ARGVFDRLDVLEEHLGGHRYLCGDALTAADWFLFPTLFRFDAVYHTHFKCNLRRLIDYPHLWGYTRELYQVPGVRETCNLAQIKEHYYTSHESIHPRRYVPIGPAVDFEAAHGRQGIGGQR